MTSLPGYIHKRLHEALNYRLRARFDGRFASLCRPTSISLLLTERCNARCVHCNIWTNRGKEDSLTEAEWRSALADLRRWLGPVQVTLTGGEALLVPYTPSLVQYGSGLGLFMEVLTHGYWNDKSRIEALARARPWRITMSLDGLGEVHSVIRGRQGFFERTASSLDTLLRLRREEALPYRIRLKTVVMRQNLAELPALADFASRDGVDIFYQPIEQNYNAAEDPEWYLHSENWPPDAAAAVAAVDRLIALRAEGRHIANSVSQLEAMKRYFADPAGLRVSTQTHASHEDALVCSALSLMQVQANGDLRVCTTRSPVGNIRERPPSEIWRSRPHWWEAGCCLGDRLSEAESRRYSPGSGPRSTREAPPPNEAPAG